MSERNNQGYISIPIANIYGFTTAIYNAVAYIASSLGFVPATDNTLMLGTSTQRWAETHTANINNTAGENTAIGNSTGTVTLNGQLTYGGPLGRPMLTRIQNTPQTLTNNTGTNITFDTAWPAMSIGTTGLTYSAGGFTNSTSNTLTLFVSAAVTFVTNATGKRILYATNSSTTIYSSIQWQGMVDMQANAGDETALQINFITLLTPSSTLSIYAMQGSGGNLNTIQDTNFSATRVTLMLM